MEPAALQTSMKDDRSARIKRVTLIGLAVNLLLSAIKLAAGILGGSQAVIADSVHSLSDSSTDVAILVGVRFWTAPADERHPHGHGRIEYIITLLIAAVLAAVAAGLAYNAYSSLYERHDTPPSWVAFAAAVASIAVKEILYRWTVATGRRIKSSAVIANAWHHRSDALSSLPAAIAVAVAVLRPDLYFIDHVGAAVVSLFILQAAWKIARPVLGRLADAGASPEELQAITDIASSVQGVDTVHAVRTRYIGAGLGVDLHIHVDGALSVRRGHEISEIVTKRLIDDGPDVLDVVVHIEPR
ncbi:MAG: cation transporter [Planctomycetes bacterium]|nr:cation transporter [Planctomycetota bacterium]